MKHYHYQVKIDRVVDGDTFDAMVDLGFMIFHSVRFRLFGCNCPETHGVSREQGLKAAARTRELVEGKEVNVEVIKFDKYGRSVAKVTGIPGYEKNLTEILLAEGQAVPFMEDQD